MSPITSRKGDQTWRKFVTERWAAAMKWFKHQTSARDDESLIIIRDEFGFEGYGRYWAILELVAGRSKNDCFELTLPTTEWCAILATKPQQLRRFLTRAGNLTLFYWSENGNVLKISAPKLADHRDNHTRNLAATCKSTGQSLPTVDTDTEIDTEEDTHIRSSVREKPQPETPPTACVSDSQNPIPPNRTGRWARSDADLLPYFRAYCAGSGQQLTWRHDYVTSTERLFAHGKPPERIEAVAKFYRSKLKDGPANFGRFAAEIDKWDAECAAPKPSQIPSRKWCPVHPGIALDRLGNCDRCAASAEVRA